MTAKDMPTKLGRYEIVRELGRGAMGVVYEGRDPNIGRRVAIKTARRDVMAASGLADEMMKRFLREASAAGALNHPNIITIYDADEQDGIAYIAMEYLEGGDLSQIIRERRRLGIEEIAGIGATICEALAAAHDQGIIHRDVKPANIMTPAGGPIKMADFGIAHVSDSTLTQDGALIGTPHYMSPEQFMGQKLDGRSDLFSVGIILYEILTGEKPFAGEALSTVMHHVIKSDPIPPSELNLSIPDALNFVILKSLSKRPQQRYANGRAMAAALRESVKEHPDPAIIGMTAESEESKTVITVPAQASTVIQAAALESTVQKVAAEERATVLRQSSAPSAAATAVLAGQPPPPAQVTEAADIKRGVPKTAWIAGIAVLIMGAVALGLFNAKGRNNQQSPDDAAMRQTSRGAISSAATPIYVTVFATRDLNARLGTDEAMQKRATIGEDEDDPLSKLCTILEQDKTVTRLEGARVSVGGQDKIWETDADGMVTVSVAGDSETVEFTVRGNVAGEEVERTFSVKGRKQWNQAQFFVLYRSPASDTPDT